MVKIIQKRLIWAVNSSIEGRKKNMTFAQGKYVDSTVAKVFVCFKIESHIHLYMNKAKRPKKLFFFPSILQFISIKFLYTEQKFWGA